MFSRKQVFQTKILDLNAVLRNLEYMLPRMLGEHIALETCYRPDLPTISADTGMIEQIVMNLVVNSRDAMPKGGKLLIADFRRRNRRGRTSRHNPEARAGEFVCLSVTDTGSGMERKVLQRIFEPFFTTKEIGKGTGLGLATVYGIVKQHQGWVEVESEVGVGTTFKIFLPVAMAEAAVTPAAAPKSETSRRRRQKPSSSSRTKSACWNWCGTFSNVISYRILIASIGGRGPAGLGRARRPN